jgi:hypothetical protein
MAPDTVEAVSFQTPNLRQEEPSQMQNTAARKLKQVPEGYLIVGIDPYKKKHAAVAITQDFTARDRFKLDNTREGLEFVVRRVRMEMVKADCRGVHTPMSKQGRPVLRYCAWTSVIPMRRFNADFRAWAKQRRERPVHANPLVGREVVGAALYGLLRLAFALVKYKTLYRSPQLVPVTG